MHLVKPYRVHEGSEMSTESISRLIQNKARQFGPKLALVQKGGDPNEKYTYRELDEASGRLATGLRDLGLVPDDRVAILCDARPRWGVVFFAALRAGAIVVPLDARQSIAEHTRTLADAQPKFLLVSSELEPVALKIAAARQQMCVLSIESAAKTGEFPSMDSISGSSVLPCVDREADDAAVLTYTSGTMGTSKGVVTTYGNLLFQVRALRQVMHNDSHNSAVSVLPLSHLFELTGGFLGILYGGGTICYCNSLLPDEIVAAMQAQEVTCMVTVPLILKFFADAIRRQLGNQPRARRVLFSAMTGLSPFLPMAIRRRLFRRIHRRFGGKLEYFVCGGAPLDLDTLQFFDRIGLRIYQGYGLAETSPVITVNAPSANRAGSVGKPLPGVKVRISASGEILTRGPHVMKGYFGNPELTNSVIDADGWLHTGDIGHIDADGFLFISGREKNVIVLGSGKKVQPEELEEVLFVHPDIQEGCIIGVDSRSGLTRGSEEICAVAVPTEAAISRCARHHENVCDFVKGLIELQSRQLAPGKRPTKIVTRTDPLPRTSTRKIRRPDIRDWLNNTTVLA